MKSLERELAGNGAFPENKEEAIHSYSKYRVNNPTWRNMLINKKLPERLKNLDELYENTKKYIYDNPNATINQVSDEVGVSIQQIQRWIRQERLSFSDASPIGMDCEKCGKMIKTGRFCQACKNTMKSEFSAITSREPQMEKLREKDANARMRFLDQD